MEEKYEGLKVHTYCIRNDFFGERITVSGLITGQDLMKQLKDQPLGSMLLIPCNMLKMDEDIFLDDFTLKEVSDSFTSSYRYCKIKRTGSDRCYFGCRRSESHRYR